jgi:3-oxoacyl-[acyl-carrier protein] reductase
MRNVIVTGGSSGIGLAVANRLSTAGYRVIAIARTARDSQFSALEENTVKTSSHTPIFLPFDLKCVEDIPKLVKKIHGAFGSIYGLVNNAGIGTDGALALMHNSKIEEILRLNLHSPIVLTKYIVRRMMADGGGRIVNMTSITGFTGFSGLSVYGATKSALIGFTRSLAREVGPMSINVNAVAPGFIETDLTNSLDEAQKQQISRRNALRRLTRVDEVAGAVEFLLGEQASGITGTILTVDAGATA